MEKNKHWKPPKTHPWRVFKAVVKSVDNLFLDYRIDAILRSRKKNNFKPTVTNCRRFF